MRSDFLLNRNVRSVRGFTLIELLVVIGMIAVLMGAVTSSVMSARKRANISRATATVREMTNAILAYENYTEDHTLKSVVTGGKDAGAGWQEATEGALAFILGKKSNSQGRIPVLFNAAVSAKGDIRDPWGHAYLYKVADAGEAQKDSDNVGKYLGTVLYLPNMNRIAND